MTKVKRKRLGDKRCKSHNSTPTTEDQPLLSQEAGTEVSTQSVALVSMQTEPTKGWKRRFCSLWKYLFTLRFFAKLCAGRRQSSLASLTSPEHEYQLDEKENGFQSPTIHQEQQILETNTYVYNNTVSPPIVIPNNVKDLSPMVLPDVQFGGTSKLSTLDILSVKYYKQGTSLLHNGFNHLGRCLNAVLSYAAKTRNIPGSFSMMQSSDPIDSCKITLIYVQNNLPACTELFGFGDDPESLNQIVEKILHAIPRVWNCEEDSETVIEIMKTQKNMVTQVADTLSQHDMPAMELAEHLRITAEEMECNIRKAGQKT